MLEFCQDNEIVVIVGLEPDKPDDITDVERAMPIGRVCTPSPFGMWTRRTGGAR